MTWASKDVVAGKKYVQIYTEGSADEFKNNHDYLWQFTPVTTQYAHLADLKKLVGIKK